MTLPKLDLAKFTDSYFKAAETKEKKKKGQEGFFEQVSRGLTAGCYYYSTGTA